MNLDKIDTSYWLIKDKSWKEARQAKWPAIEKMVGLDLKRAEVNVVKAYFLRGKMPKWEKYSEIHEGPRPLHLSYFLWLHPSDDPEVLRPLYRRYMESVLIHPEDIIQGYHALLSHELLSALSPVKSLKEYEYPYMGEKNIILFRILFEDISYVKQFMHRLVDKDERFNKHALSLFNTRALTIFDYLGYIHFLNIWHWLLQKEKSPLMLNSLYQYDEVLEWCLTTLSENKEQELLNGLTYSVNVTNFQKAFYCIYHFDNEKEEDSCRSRALIKVRQLLDEHDFIPEFKQMWEDTKSGKIDVKNPWKR